MKKINLFLILFAIFAFTQCDEPNAKPVQAEEITVESEMAQTDEVADQNKPFYQGTILEAIDAGGYTYLKIEENLEGHKHEEGHVHKDFWVAVEKTPAHVGDVVRFQKELVTEQFYSKILDRTFDELMFASNLQHKLAD